MPKKSVHIFMLPKHLCTQVFVGVYLHGHFNASSTKQLSTKPTRLKDVLIGSCQPHYHKGPSIYYVIQDGGEGSSRFITILHRGGLPNLLQYYIGGFFKVYYNVTDLEVIWKGLDHLQYYMCFYVVLKVRNFVR